MQPTPRRDAIELGAALLTAAIHMLPLEHFYPEVVEIVVLAGGWLGYLVYLAVRERPRLQAMGFARSQLAGSVVASGAVLVIASLAMAGWGAALGTLRVHWHMLVLAALYPLWGLVQQWLILGVLARQLASRIAPVWTVLATALVFGALHLPQVSLAIATLVLGLALTPIYLRWRNLWPLGFVHGWLAIPMYFWVLGIDPWAKVTS
jgi:uncharacterized protein